MMPHLITEPRRTGGTPTYLLALAVISLASAVGASPASGQAPAGDPAPARPAPGQQVALVTGSTDGLGREVARRLAAGGAHVIVHGRNRERGEALVAEIRAEGRGSARFYSADLASMDRVRELGDAIARDYDRLELLVNNAGVWLDGDDRRLSPDGHELHFAVNYLAGYVLTHRLLPLLTRSAPSRIVNVASIAQRPIDFDDVMMERGYSASRGYAQSKLAQVLFTVELAGALAGSNVTVVALHPATMMNTPMVLSRGAAPRSSVEDGATAVMQAATSPAVESGQYFNGLQPARANAQAYDEEARRRLERLSRELTGVR